MISAMCNMQYALIRIHLEKRNLQFNTECHRICQSLDELIKSRSLHLKSICDMYLYL